jgi:hypothetical protein
MISNTVRSLLLEVGVFGHTDIWSAVCDLLSSSNEFLDYTTAVVVYAATVDNQRVVECRQVSKDIPGVRAFGYEFKSCGTPGCHPAPADIRVYNNAARVHLRCLKCKWRSGWVKTDQDNKHFKRINKMIAPSLFWHYFPPTTSLQNFFVEVPANEDNRGHATSSPKEKGKKDKKGKGKQRDIELEIKEDLEMGGCSSNRMLPMDLD